MRFAYAIVYVENVAATLAFYEAAFGFQRKFITPELDYGELHTGETTIAFAALPLGEENFKQGFEPSSRWNKPLGVEFAFTTDQPGAAFQRALDAGATPLEPLTEKIWGQTVGYVRDINGFLIEICTPLASED